MSISTSRRSVLSTLGVAAFGSMASSVSPAAARAKTTDHGSAGVAKGSPVAAAGWKVEYAVRPNGLRGANGMRVAPDGRKLYITQVHFRRISTLDLSTGALSVLAPEGGGGDDVDFDSAGNMYITAEDNVTERSPDGRSRDLWIEGDFHNSNGIHVAGDRIFVDEEAPHGRLMELFRDGRPPRIIAKDLPFPNGLRLHSDGNIYVPMGLDKGRIMRVPVEGGPVELFVGDLVYPGAVKFAPSGELFVSESDTGRIYAIDMNTRQKRLVGQSAAGMDNFDVGPDGRVYTSCFMDGGIHTLSPKGEHSVLIPGSFIGPWGLAAGPDGVLYIADSWSYAEYRDPGSVRRPANVISDLSYPMPACNIAVGADGGLIFATANRIKAYSPTSGSKTLASGLIGLRGLAAGPDGRIFATQEALGHVVEIMPDRSVTIVADRLKWPSGLAYAGGTLYVAEAGSGRLLAIRDGKITTLLEGLDEPHGVAATAANVYVISAASGRLHRVSRDTGQAEVIARDLPVRSARSPCAPAAFFTGVAAVSDRKIYVSGTDDGSLVRVIAN